MCLRWAYLWLFETPAFAATKSILHFMTDAFCACSHQPCQKMKAPLIQRQMHEDKRWFSIAYVLVLQYENEEALGFQTFSCSFLMNTWHRSFTGHFYMQNIEPPNFHQMRLSIENNSPIFPFSFFIFFFLTKKRQQPECNLRFHSSGFSKIKAGDVSRHSLQ